MAPSDATLVERLPEDDSGEELRELYRRYSSELFGFACNALGDRELAEEVVQDVFARLWRARGGLRPAPGERAHLALRDRPQPHRRRAPARVRAARRSQPGPSTRAAAEIDRELEQAVLRWQVAAALARLSPEHREVIRLAHYGGLSLREISERKGIPLGTAKSRTSYALRTLRLILDEMEVARVSGCPTHGALLGGYVLGSLEPAEMDEMRRHLGQLPAMRAGGARARRPAGAARHDRAGRRAAARRSRLELEEAVLDRFARERGRERRAPARRAGARAAPGRGAAAIAAACVAGARRGCWSAATSDGQRLRERRSSRRSARDSPRRTAWVAEVPAGTRVRLQRARAAHGQRRRCTSSGASAPTAAG